MDRNIGIFIIGISLLYFVTMKSVVANIDPETEDAAISKAYNLHLIPGRQNNYRSGQIPKNKLAAFIKKYGIKHIIRMNGNGADSRMRSSDPYTSIAEEKKICEENGCEFHFVSPHKGYIPGKGYVSSANEIAGILKQGNTWIHCLWGADRTGGMVAAYLKKSGIMPDERVLWSYTTKYNNWKDYIKRGKFYGSGFDKYAETFIPLSKVKELTK